MNRIAIIAFATLAASGAMSAKEAPVATPSGKPIDCVQLTQIRETRVRSDQVIDFILRDGNVLRNTLPFACPELGFEESFSYRTSIDRLCSVDTITVLRRAGGLQAGVTCGLGSFQPVTLAG